MGRPKGSKNKPKNPSLAKKRGRPPGSKNKDKVTCEPPSARFDDEPLKPAEIFDVQVKVILERNSTYDGVYIFGKRPGGENYVGKIPYVDHLPVTSELCKRLGIVKRVLEQGKD
jgi:hypothetical protein